MKQDIDPFADEADSPAQEGLAEQQTANRFGSGTIRQALSRWWLMLLFGMLGYAGALYYMSIIPPSSEAVAVLEVDIKQRQVMGAELETDRLTPELVLATAASKLSSPTVLMKVAQSPEVQALQRLMPPKFSFKPRYMRSEEELAFLPASEVEPVDIVDKMAKGWVEITGRRNTSLIDISVSHPDPESARVIADAILRVFLEDEMDSKKGGTNAVFESLKRESEIARQDLDGAQRSLQVYVSASKLNEQIQEARAELVNLRQRYKAKHPKMLQFSSVYEDLNVRFRREIKRASAAESEKSYWLRYKDELDALDAKVTAENDVLGESADEWLSIAQNALNTRANLLNARILQGQQLYERLTQRLTELDVADDEDADQYKIVQQAFIGLAQDSMRMIYLAAGSILGMAAGFGIAYLLGVIDYKIYDVRSVEEITGLGCMAAVPQHECFARSAKSEWVPILKKDPNSANAEAIRNLRASVVLLGQKSRHKILLVTSAIPGEGKTTMATELATSFALNGERTLLVGMDLRKPRLEGLFPELKGRPGVTEVLSGQAELKDCVVQDGFERLYVLGAGGKCANPSELLHDEELKAMFTTISANFDRIIIDSAPILPVSDSRVLAKYANSIIMVVRARKAPVGAVLRSISLLKSAGKGPAGVVINGLKKTGGQGYYGYKGYGEYNGEYGYYGDEK